MIGWGTEVDGLGAYLWGSVVAPTAADKCFEVVTREVVAGECSDRRGQSYHTQMSCDGKGKEQSLSY